VKNGDTALTIFLQKKKLTVVPLATPLREKGEGKGKEKAAYSIICWQREAAACGNCPTFLSRRLWRKGKKGIESSYPVKSEQERGGKEGHVYGTVPPATRSRRLDGGRRGGGKKKGKKAGAIELSEKKDKACRWRAAGLRSCHLAKEKRKEGKRGEGTLYITLQTPERKKGCAGPSRPTTRCPFSRKKEKRREGKDGESSLSHTG